MDHQAGKPGRNIGHFIPHILIGIGLIISGFVAFKLITNGGNSYDYSVVPAAVSFPAPELTLNDLNGEKVSISDYQEQVLLINNWAIWCPPCKDEIMVWQILQGAQCQGFMLIGIKAGDLSMK
jgi:thiol-disulfide isomerase/thioredoxin